MSETDCCLAATHEACPAIPDDPASGASPLAVTAAAQHGLCGLPPGVEVPALRAARARVLGETDWERPCAGCAPSSTPSELQVGALLAGTTGASVQRLAAVRRGDYDRAHPYSDGVTGPAIRIVGSAKLPEPSIEWLPLPPDVAAVLDSWIEFAGIAGDPQASIWRPFGRGPDVPSAVRRRLKDYVRAVYGISHGELRRRVLIARTWAYAEYHAPSATGRRDGALLPGACDSLAGRDVAAREAVLRGCALFAPAPHSSHAAALPRAA